MHMIGADPELFIQDNKSKEFVPATRMLGGTKESPLYYDDGFAVQEDNVTAEYNIPPATTVDEWVSYHNKAHQKLQEMVGNTRRLVARPAADFSPEWFEKFPELMESGCNPDMSVYTFEQSTPNGSFDNKTRYAGGHVHVSCDYGWEDELNLVKWMDILIAVPFAKMEADGRRRLLYGQAGVYRQKEYGIEYRTPSSTWVRYPKWQRYVFCASQRACEIIDRRQDYLLMPDDILQDAINNRNMEKLHLIMKNYTDLYKEVVQNARD